MKKIILSLVSVAILMFSYENLSAQKVSESTVSVNGESATGMIGEYQINKKDLVKVADKYFSKNVKGKSGSAKGYTVYKAAQWNIYSLDQSDIYYKVDGNKTTSTLTIVVSKGYSNFVSSSSDGDVVNSVKAFLVDFNSTVEAFTLEQRIAEQKKVIEKKEKKYNKGLKGERKLEKKIVKTNKKAEKNVKKLEKKIEKNKKKYEATEKNLLKEKEKLEELERSK